MYHRDTAKLAITDGIVTIYSRYAILCAARSCPDVIFPRISMCSSAESGRPLMIVTSFLQWARTGYLLVINREDAAKPQRCGKYNAN